MLNIRLLSIVMLLVFACAGVGLLRLDIDTDLVRSLPDKERVIADALEIFRNHPIHDQVAIDIMINRDDPDILVECGAILEEQLRESGLFTVVGTKEIGNLIPDLARHVVANLPLLYSAEDLERYVVPLLQSDDIRRRLRQTADNLGSLEGIGQAPFIENDPLGLRDPVMARLALLAPSMSSRFYRDSLISLDGRHLLVTGKPVTAGTDTAAARKISQLITISSQALSRKYADQGLQVTVTPVGAYRAALDNERIIRHDVRQALLLSTCGIALLLLFSFHRPLIGLLSLVPAMAGTAAALLVYSLFHSSISIMILGFGGAIISITVDHGIAYLLFLDCPHETKGRDAAREAWAVGIMAVLTTIGSFMALSLSGFPIFIQLGQFTALGIFFSFLFVHSVFPRIVPTMAPAVPRALPLRKLVEALYRTGGTGAAAGVLLALGMLFFARPVFHVSLSSMNSVSNETLAADSLFSRVWGDVGDRVYLMVSADSMKELQQKNDRLLKKINRDRDSERIASAFVPSMIFPGKERARQNLAAWNKFWDEGRRANIAGELNSAGTAFGFTRNAFSPFLSMLGPSREPATSLVPPTPFRDLLGIAENNTTGQLIQFITVTPGKHYDGSAFFTDYSRDGRIFDASLFSKRLAGILFSTFTTMLLIIAVSIVLLLLLFFSSWQLTLLTLTPVIFAYICTLGSLHLIGHPLDIPSLMLSIVILGMGIDYSIFTVRAHQRYGDINHPSYALVRTAVFMAGASTLIGFGVLCFADHALLKSIGITSFFGIAYSLLGTFLLLPPLLDLYFSGTGRSRRADGDIASRVRRRYRLLETYPRMFARFKLLFDPMFNALPRMLAEKKEVRRLLDIGCGYGVPACWCLEYFPQARVFGIDPDPEKTRVASRAAGSRGDIVQGGAPDLPVIAEAVDVILMLDMLHYLNDEAVCSALAQSRQLLVPGGTLVIRFALPAADKPSWSWRLEDYRVKMSGIQPWYRSADGMAEMLFRAGFVPVINEVSTANPELVWMVGRADMKSGDEK